ncbi:type II toxin-antitoxin system Phd/YefM family antitoxin [Companilactobacillus pabuli]|jgi:PHD/YefM family antitoxin component YafN of YafNO toxin-antitoxin module|uniref:Antitoxin n=1 Tax=Companilactobacillus pabuli TaxID=2714036 RepID=A0A7L7KVM5_9LACO|nr:type II toxin-antitoxin system Phd/YefM family antitoxin [Companilactobacillus pabuli]QMT83346.1 hypothetical protein G6534_01170 [Companilactobacillus pabuli]GAQ02441.1 hypothetical protein NBRC111452_2284 [Companilactobacillus farciminis]
MVVSKTTTDFLGKSITSISDLKKSPQKLFDQSNNTNEGIFVFNRNKPEGVLLSLKHYDDLIKENRILREKLDKAYEKLLDEKMNIESEKRIKDHLNNHTKMISEDEVLGDGLKNIKIDDEDGWE